VYDLELCLALYYYCVKEETYQLLLNEQRLTEYDDVVLCHTHHDFCEVILPLITGNYLDANRACKRLELKGEINKQYIGSGEPTSPHNCTTVIMVPSLLFKSDLGSALFSVEFSFTVPNIF
jgi:hypothetical protein